MKSNTRVAGFTKNLFKGRLGRLDYLLYLLLINAGVFIISFVFMLILTTFISEGSRISIPKNAFFFLYLIIAIYITFIISAQIKRLHDMNFSGFWILINLIPIVNGFFELFLIFYKGNTSRNSYGEINNKKNFFNRILNPS